MLIDCAGCAVRDVACGDCVVTVLLGPPGERDVDGRSSPAAGAPPLQLELADRRALRVLADAGLVPRLRHQPAGESRAG